MSESNVWKRGIPSAVGMYIAWLPHKYGGYYLAVIEMSPVSSTHYEYGLILIIHGGWDLLPRLSSYTEYLNRTMFHTTVTEFATQPPPPVEVQELDGSSEIPGLTFDSVPK